MKTNLSKPGDLFQFDPPNHVIYDLWLANPNFTVVGDIWDKVYAGERKIFKADEIRFNIAELMRPHDVYYFPSLRLYTCMSSHWFKVLK